MSYLLTVDVGTSSTKTALWTEDGRLVYESASAYSLRRPDPLSAEIDAEIWWQAVCTTIRAVVKDIDPHQIVGIGVDAVGWTLLPVDSACTPLFPALIWLDRRAQSETDWLNALPDAHRLIALDANPLDAAYVMPKLLWLKAHHPAIFAAAHRFLSASGFITTRLTGEFTCDFTQAYGYHCFDMARACWDANAADRLGIPLDRLPRLCPPTEIIGTLTAAAAEQIGLPAGIPVIAGCLDAASGALGAGVTRIGQTNEQGGQAGGFAVSLDHVVVEPQLIFSHHVIPGQYLLQAGTVGGGSLGWFRDLLAQGSVPADLSFEALSAEAQNAPPGANGVLFLPYMAGERTPLWNSHARGVFFGLSYATTRADLIRAIMEGCAFAVRDNLATAEARGVHVSEWLASGGAARSAVWSQIKADVYAKPFILARRADGGEGGHSLGLFALTAFALGLSDDIAACVERLLPQRQIYTPSPPRAALYDDLFAIYRELSRKLLPDFDRLAAVTRKHSTKPEQTL